MRTPEEIAAELWMLIPALRWDATKEDQAFRVTSLIREAALTIRDQDAALSVYRDIESKS